MCKGYIEDNVRPVSGSAKSLVDWTEQNQAIIGLLPVLAKECAPRPLPRRFPANWKPQLADLNLKVVTRWRDYVVPRVRDGYAAAHKICDVLLADNATPEWLKRPEMCTLQSAPFELLTKLSIFCAEFV